MIRVEDIEAAIKECQASHEAGAESCARLGVMVRAFLEQPASLEDLTERDVAMISNALGGFVGDLQGKLQVGGLEGPGLSAGKEGQRGRWSGTSLTLFGVGLVSFLALAGAVAALVIMLLG